MKDKGLALRVAGAIFLLVALMHLLRLLWKVQVSVAGHPVRLYLSLIGFLVAFLLAIWMLTASKK